MIITKIIKTRLDLFGPNEYICANYDIMLKNKLKEKYVGRCFRSSYILDILSIINRSNINCKSKTLDGSLYVDILFEAKCLIYEVNEVIHGCKIIDIGDNNMMVAKSEYAAIQIKNKNMTIFTVDQSIPVITTAVKYNLFLKEISVLAKPLQPLEKKVIFYQIEEGDGKIKLEPEFAEINELEDDLKKLHKSHKKVYEFFVELLYPYKKNIKYDSKVKTIAIDNKLMDTINSDKDVVFFKPNCKLDDKMIYYCDHSDAQSVNNKTIIVNMCKSDVIFNLIHIYKKNLLELREFIIHYDTLDKIKDQKNLWQLYNMLKL